MQEKICTFCIVVEYRKLQKNRRRSLSRPKKRWDMTKERIITDIIQPNTCQKEDEDGSSTAIAVFVHSSCSTSLVRFCSPRSSRSLSVPPINPSSHLSIYHHHAFSHAHTPLQLLSSSYVTAPFCFIRISSLNALLDSTSFSTVSSALSFLLFNTLVY